MPSSSGFVSTSIEKFDCGMVWMKTEKKNFISFEKSVRVFCNFIKID